MKPRQNPATSPPDVYRENDCVQGSFQLDYSPRSRDSWTDVQFEAKSVEWRGDWVIFRRPTLMSTLRGYGFPVQSTVTTFDGFYRVPARRISHITYNTCAVAA